MLRHGARSRRSVAGANYERADYSVSFGIGKDAVRAVGQRGTAPLETAALCGDDENEDAMEVYTATVAFGWCGKCMGIIDLTTPDLAYLGGRDGVGHHIQYKGDLRGCLTIVDHLRKAHNFVMLAGAVADPHVHLTFALRIRSGK